MEVRHRRNHLSRKLSCPSADADRSQRHRSADARIASRIPATMTFGAGTDEDKSMKVR